jgi:hypothetical protein
MSGYEVARRLGQQPWRQTMRLLALSGWGKADNPVLAADAGFDAQAPGFPGPAEAGGCAAAEGSDMSAPAQPTHAPVRFDLRCRGWHGQSNKPAARRSGGSQLV